MARFLATGDIHLTDGPRFDDQRKVLDAIAVSAHEHVVDAVVVGGDLSGTTVPHLMTTGERNALCDWFTVLAEAAPVMIVGGNHDDYADIDIFRRLRTKHPVEVFTRPGVMEVGDVRFCALPYTTKGRVLGKLANKSIEEQNAAVGDALHAILNGFGAGRKVLVAHMAVRGCAVAGGEVLIGQEIELARDWFDAFEYVALSHIHLAQDFGPRIRYAGSPDRSNFGEHDDKGWNIVDLDTQTVTRVPSPARRFVTLEGTWDNGWQLTCPDLTGCEVRLNLTVRDEDLPTVDFEAADALARKAGAVAVKLNPKAVTAVKVRSVAVAQAKTLGEKLRATFATWGQAAPDATTTDRCVEKAEALR